jgi:hypothetical protein
MASRQIVLTAVTSVFCAFVGLDSYAQEQPSSQGASPVAYAWHPVPRHLTIYRHASSPAESFARGIAAVLRARGDLDLNTARARAIAAEACRVETQNRLQRTEAAFQMRQANRRARTAERRPRPSHEDLIRLAQKGRPARLSPRELDDRTGEVTWPMLLEAAHYDRYRAALEGLFTARASDGQIGPAAYLEIARLTSAMLELLKGCIHEVPPAEYMVAKRFLESLANEARLPAG